CFRPCLGLRQRLWPRRFSSRR
ncbi:MAG: hypothetical protein AVDCRST_MAG93-3718, partial [uncultured Chloroflexia bacterium]